MKRKKKRPLKKSTTPAPPLPENPPTPPKNVQETTSVPVSATSLPRLSPMAITAISTILILFSVWCWAWLTTCDFFPHTLYPKEWLINGKPRHDDGNGMAVTFSRQGISLLHRLPRKKYAYTRFRGELTLKDQGAISLFIIYYPGGVPQPGEQLTTRSINRYTRSRGRRLFLDVPFDDFPGIMKSEIIGLYLRTAQKKAFSRGQIRNLRLLSYTPHERWQNMRTILFRYQPLRQYHNNMIDSPKIKGRGYLFLFWIAWGISAGLLGFRIFVLEEKLSLSRHLFLATLILFILADLRNCSEMIRQAKDAWKQKHETPDIDALLARHERAVPWFMETLRFIRDEMPSGKRYYLLFRGNPKRAVQRVAYYAMPARRTHDPKTADYVLLCNAPPKEAQKYARSSAWEPVRTIHKFIHVYRRRSTGGTP